MLEEDERRCRVVCVFLRNAREVKSWFVGGGVKAFSKQPLQRLARTGRSVKYFPLFLSHTK